MMLFDSWYCCKARVEFSICLAMESFSVVGSTAFSELEESKVRRSLTGT